jgi:hypothetical protein
MAGELQGSIPKPKPAITDVPKGVQQTANAPFYLRFHPNRWMVSGGRVLPQLGKLKEQRGVNGVDKDTRMEQALGASKRGGWTLIPRDVQGPGTDYLREYPTVKGGTFHCLQWTRLYIGDKQVHCDDEGYRSFLAQLRKQGVVPPPGLHILGAMLEKVDTRIEEAQDKIGISPSWNIRLRNLEAEKAVLEEEIASIRAALAPIDPAYAFGGDEE